MPETMPPRIALTAGDEDAERILPYALAWFGGMQVANVLNQHEQHGTRTAFIWQGQGNLAPRDGAGPVVAAGQTFRSSFRALGF
jgi:hypothetical protein